MRAVINYKTILVTEGGNIHEEITEILPGDTSLERIFRKRERLHSDPNRLVYDIQIKFCDGND